ncbi:MAG: S8 family serine peptidase [Planctomycetota bacterium]
MRHSGRPRKKSLIDWFAPRRSAPLRKAPRRRTLEQLEPRHLMTASPETNPLFADQWHLFANGQFVEQPDSPFFNQSFAVEGEDINALAAWALGYTGAGVQVGVVDGGFDLSHEDLVFRTDLGFDLIGNDADTQYGDLTDAHGTAVAGIIGARDNTVGGVGLAHEADIVPIRLIPGQFDTQGAPLSRDPGAFLLNAGTIAQQQSADIAPENIIDVFNHSWGYSNIDRSATQLGGPNATEEESQVIRDAIQESVLTGRATYLGDADGDGIRDAEEFESLGTIHVVSAGNEAGNSFSNIFDSVGGYTSAQYEELANSRYTIAVGAVDFDGRYKNPSSGSVTGWAQTGSNVLIVAPSGVVQLDNGSIVFSGGGIRTSDNTGEDGFNQAPTEILPGVGIEVDGDFLADTNYTSTFNGTSAAAPQVSATVALMLEANPNLNWREVQQILMMSARQNDQFSETWVTNPIQSFDNTGYVVPQYVYYDVQLDGDDEPEEENVILPNSVDLDVIRAIYLNEPNLALPAGLLGNLVDTTGIQTGEGEAEGEGDPPPVFITIVDSGVPEGDDGINNPDPIEIFPVQGNNEIENFFTGVDFLTSPQLSGNEQTTLRFENGAGYTVSQGWGDFLEEIGYAHGVLDAGLAVEIAEAWAQDDVGLGEEVTITTFVSGAGGNPLRFQPAALVPIVEDDSGTTFVPLKVSGGNALPGIDINTAFYEQFYVDYETTTITDVDDNEIGDVITGGPFYNPEGDLDLDGPQRGIVEFDFDFDPEIFTDFISVESLELRTTIRAGDIDQLRVALRSPDGTQTELNPFREQSGEAGVIQSPFGQQGSQVGSDDFLPTSAPSGEIAGVSLVDALPVDTPWTWTTNRHWGELFAVDANAPGGLSTNGWTLIIENWGTSEILFADELAFTVNGAEATGSRIQGKIGIDDNAQGIPGYDADENFNFNRNLQFGLIEYENAFGDVFSVQVVLDNPDDSVGHSTSDPVTNNIYRTRDPITGDDVFMPVINAASYFEEDEAAFLVVINNLLVQQGKAPDAVAASVSGALTAGETDGRIVSFQNHDFSQESFAAGVTVVATQYRTAYDAAGNISAPQPTGVVQKFITGADGNYYFDVETTPDAPSFSGDPVWYAEWLAEFGETFSYEISLEGAATQERIIQRPYTSLQEDGFGDAFFSFGNNGSYQVEIASSPLVGLGGTSVIKDVNFLLQVDPALTDGVVGGQIYVDYDNNGVFDGDDVAASGVAVTLTYVDNGVEQTRQTFTNETGNYSLARPNAGEGELVDVAISNLPEGFSALNPSDGDQSVALARGGSVTADFTLNLDGALPGQAALVTGIVFDDADGDGVQGPGEGPLSGVRVYADGTGGGADNDAYDPGEVFATTSSNGAFTLAFNTGDTYELRIDFETGAAAATQQTTPLDGTAIGPNFSTPIMVAAISGETQSELLFGLRGASIDFGDLDGYASASHVVIQQVRLGANVSAELEQIAGNLDTFDDGVTMVPQTMTPGGTVGFLVDGNFTGASLNAWIDFDNNGVFDADEQIFTNLGLDTEAEEPVLVTASINADLDLEVEQLAARFRWGPTGVGPSGLAISGEVEDYLIYRDPTAPAAASALAAMDAADFDGNGVVNELDYDLWVQSFGLTGPLLSADGNGDQIVDLRDYTVWADGFNSSQQTMPVGGSMPENPPAAFSLATAPPPLSQPGFLEEEPTAAETLDVVFALPTSAESFPSPPMVEADLVDPAANDEALLLLTTDPAATTTPAVVETVEEDNAEEDEPRSRRDTVQDRLAERRAQRRASRRG